MKIYYQDPDVVIIHGDCREIVPHAKFMNSLTIALGFDPRSLNWSAVAIVRPKRGRGQRGQDKQPHGRPNKWGLPAKLNKRDHAAYVRQWRALRAASQLEMLAKGKL